MRATYIFTLAPARLPFFRGGGERVSSPSQDVVIEKVLRSRGKWDPRWLRKRPARGATAGEVAGQRRPPGETRIEYNEG